MGGGWEYACAACGVPYAESYVDYCARCGAPVLASRAGDAAPPTRAGGPDGARGIWRYAADLPLDPAQAWLSLGESGTPVVPAPALAKRLGAGQVWLKLDHLNPTGSFKDRAAAAGVAHALRHGARAVVCASSGNAAASAAAYAARAGLPAIIVVPAQVPANKLAGSLAHHAIPLAVPGDYSRSFALARRLCAELGLTNLATTYVNPHAIAALRSVAFDLVEQVGPRVDWVHVPTGSGPLVHGVAQGFRDLAARGAAAGVPRMVAAQPAGCAPIAAAFDAGRDTVEPWPEVTTAVSGINDPLRGYEGDGTLTLRELRATGGSALALSDADILAAQRLLAYELGVFVEPAAAASVAGLFALGERSAYGRDDTVVCLLTGHGLKTVGAAEVEPAVVADVPAAVDALARAGLEVD